MKILALLLSLLCGPAFAQGGMMPGPGSPHAAATYTGPGDVVSGASFWGSCARAYNAAYANGTNPLCDLVDSAASTVVICTLRVKTNGLVDLTGTYCTGSVTPAAKCAAATGGVCQVKQLYDQSGANACSAAPCHLVATTTGQPILLFSAQNGLPGLTGTNAAGTVMAASVALTQALPMSMSVVLNRTGSFVPSSIAIGQRNTAVGIGANGTGNFGMACTSFVSVAATNSVIHAFNATLASAASVGNIDGTDVGGTQNCGSTGFSANAIGLFRSSGASTEGTIMEAGIWFGTSFTSGNRGAIATNQRDATNGYNF